MGEQASCSENVSEWPQKDKRRFLHAAIYVPNLQATIKFYIECLGMNLLRTTDFPEAKQTNAFLGFGSEGSHCVIKLIYNYGVERYDVQQGFGHFTITTQDVHKMVENIQANGGVVQDAGTINVDNSVIAFIRDSNGYTFKLIQSDPTPEPLCHIMLRVSNMDSSIKFYEKALGMKLLKMTVNRKYKYDTAIMGYGKEYETTVLQLNYLYGVTEYLNDSKKFGYAEIVVSTDDAFKSAVAGKLVAQELGGNVTCEPGTISGVNTKMVSFVDPDGWKTVLVENEEFLKEFQEGMEQLSVT